jgi:hypothetical protein
MKRLLICLFLFLTINHTHINAQTPAPPGDKIWEIDSTTASEMMDRLNSCGLFKPCHGKGNISNPNTDEYNWLLANYATVTPVDARYRKADVDRYMQARGLQNEPKKYKVLGYKTVIYKVTSKALTGGTYYFDFVTICPPPDDGAGNCAVMSSSKN